MKLINARQVLILNCQEKFDSDRNVRIEVSLRTFLETL